MAFSSHYYTLPHEQRSYGTHALRDHTQSHLDGTVEDERSTTLKNDGGCHHLNVADGLSCEASHASRSPIRHSLRNWISTLLDSNPVHVKGREDANSEE